MNYLFAFVVFILVDRVFETRMNNLTEIVYACRAYRDDHYGMYPNAMDDLFPDYIDDRVKFEGVNYVYANHDSNPVKGPFVVFTDPDPDSDGVREVGSCDRDVDIKSVHDADFIIPKEPESRMPSSSIPPTPVVRMYIEVSTGELLNNIAMLMVQKKRVNEPNKLAEIKTELAALEKVLSKSLVISESLKNLIGKLMVVNKTLFEIDDEMEICEKQGEYGARFVESSRNRIKYTKVKSELIEEINNATK